MTRELAPGETPDDRSVPRRIRDLFRFPVSFGKALRRWEERQMDEARAETRKLLEALGPQTAVEAPESAVARLTLPPEGEWWAVVGGGSHKGSGHGFRGVLWTRTEAEAHYARHRLDALMEDLDVARRGTIMVIGPRARA